MTRQAIRARVLSASFVAFGELADDAAKGKLAWRGLQDSERAGAPRFRLECGFDGIKTAL